MSSDQDTLQQGSTVGCYEIEEVLGRGGFAVTYLAIDRNLDLYVAIKEYLPREIITRNNTGDVHPRESEFAEDYKIGLENFAREAKTLALFKHPNIVRVHQVLHENNTAYMVMDYEHGQELAEVLETRKSLPEEELRPILKPVLDAVAEIHQQGYVHRDIKPSNIYLRDNGTPVLLDFGAARYTMSETTQQLTAVVTVGYTPIEQYNVSDADQGPWTDMYALSAVLYEAVTGSMPVDSVTRASTTLTDAADPLVPVRNKSLHPCSDDFYQAIDWGLKMDPLQRPRSVSEWNAVLDGQPQAAPENPVPQSPVPQGSAAQSPALQSPVPQSQAPMPKPDRPVRASRLRIREKTPPATETESQQRTSVELAMQDLQKEHQPGSRIEPSFSASLDDLEGSDPQGRAELPRQISVANGTDQRLQTESSNTGFSPLETNRLLDTTGPATLPEGSPNAERETIAEERDTAAADSAATHASDVSSTVASTVASTAGAAAAAALPADSGKSHTQEIRDVVRRDIMKRDVESAEIKAQPEEPGYQVPPPTAREPRKPGRILTRADAGLAHQGDTASFELSAQRGALLPHEMQPDDMPIDQSDWDYEPPDSPSRWKWLIPAGGLMAVFAASLLYVNRPELFQLDRNQLPELTVDAALEQAQDKVASSQFIFPAGESALDYYQLVLGSEPDNAEALAGVDLVKQQIQGEIARHMEDNSLSEANRLLSRANTAGLSIDDVPTAAGGNITRRQVTAIDQDLSPFVQRKIAEIERQIELGDAESAQALFTETDKFIPDPEVSRTLQSRIQAVREGNSQSDRVITQTNPSTFADASDELDLEPEQPSLARTDTALDSASGLAGVVPPITNSISRVAGNPYTNTEVPARSTENTAETTDLVDDAVAGVPEPATSGIDATGIEAGSGIDTSDADDTDAVSDTTNDRGSNIEPPASAPRRSFIEGSGESAQHLNRLRTALEAKNMNRVLQVSSGLPKERVDFLNQMFSRYDRLDVVIDRISNQQGEISARLNVSMFNKRNDGSFYSAGRWNGVTLKSSKVDEQWQKIEW